MGQALAQSEFASYAYGHKISSDSELLRKQPRTLRFVCWEQGGVLETSAMQRITLGRGSAQDGTTVNLGLLHGAQHGVSRHHALIRPCDDGYVIADLDSTNGTFLNGEPLIPHRPYPLRHKDELRIGQLRVQVLFVR